MTASRMGTEGRCFLQRYICICYICIFCKDIYAYVTYIFFAKIYMHMLHMYFFAKIYMHIGQSDIDGVAADTD